MTRLCTIVGTVGSRIRQNRSPMIKEKRNPEKIMREVEVGFMEEGGKYYMSEEIKEKRKPVKRMRDEWKECGIGEIGLMTVKESNAVAEWMRRHGKSVVRNKEGKDLIMVWRDR